MLIVAISVLTELIMFFVLRVILVEFSKISDLIIIINVTVS